MIYIVEREGSEWQEIIYVGTSKERAMACMDDSLEAGYVEKVPPPSCSPGREYLRETKWKRGGVCMWLTEYQDGWNWK
jgi:hypothetical protein